MKRFTITPSTSIHIEAMNGRNLIGSINDDGYRTIADCIRAAQDIAERNNSTLTEVRILNKDNERYAAYTASGKRIY